MAKKKVESNTVELSERDLLAKSKGAVFCIKIEDEKGVEKCLYLKHPHRDVIGMYWGMKQQNPIKAAEILFRANKIADVSDEDIFEGDNFYSAFLNIDDYLDVIPVKKNRSMTL